MKGVGLIRKKPWDRHGVSEVIGTILTLSITVVLFSSIIMMVSDFPAPGNKVYTDFTATVEPINDWANGAYIHITNTGGQVMTGMWTMIAMSIDDHTYVLHTRGMQDGFPYGLGTNVPGHKGMDNGDDDWDTGERWTLYRNGTQISRSSDISVMILDNEKSALVWSAVIQGERNQFPPLISGIRADSDPGTLRSDPVAYGRPFYIFARVTDSDGDLDTGSVYADLSGIVPGQSHVNMTDPDGDGVFTSGPVMGPDTSLPIGYHIAVIHAFDLTGKHTTGAARIAVGQDLGGQPNLVIRDVDISLSSSNPTNGQTILITATVRNYGGWCNGTMYFYDIMGNQSTTITMENFTISDSPDQVTKTVSWVASPGGYHEIMVRADPTNAMDAEPDNNFNYTQLMVMPTILLVDDDNHPADGSAGDTVGFMRAALDSGNFEYDMYTVGAGRDGPGYDYGETRMMDYDIVIWMTGYESTSTLTALDRTNIANYLDDALGRGRAGSMWLIGQYLYQDSIPMTFFQDHMKAASARISPTGPTDPLMGVGGNPVSDDWSAHFIPMMERAAGETFSYQVQPDTPAGAEITFVTGDPAWGDAVDYEDVTLDSRVLFCPWEFSRIEMTADQTQVAYKAIMWLGNISAVFGQDLAVSQQTVEPRYVFYNQQVRVNATVRNNGGANISTEAILFLDGAPLKNTLMPDITIEGMGGAVEISANWTANVLGTHVLAWMVDPNNHITETNEANNVVSSYVSSGEVYVEFRILVVDDDASANNNGTLGNDTSRLTDSLSRLGYTYESPRGVNTTYVVPLGQNGPPISLLQDYSAVFWVTGESVGGLTVQDSLDLEDYLLNSNGRLWLAGDDLWSGIPGANITREMGINSTVADVGVSGFLRGVDTSNISYGMNISILANPQADVLVPESGAEGVLYDNYAAGTYLAVAYDQGSYQGLTCGFNLSTFYGPTVAGHLTGDDAMDEFTYLFLHFLGKPDTRDEVRITELDYYVSDAHPQIGGAYILRATVHNVGHGETNLLVRFMDGDTQVGADTISVSPDNSTSAEIIWRPLFAGQRTISILVDPINDEPEVFDWFNNNVSFGIYVYFFWDDMESGAAKWSHASTVMNINGENALDYVSPDLALSTDIITDWNWNQTYGVENVTTTAHSYPNSFYMEEGGGMFGVMSDVLVAIVIDNSPSMTDRTAPDGRTYIRVVKDAAIQMVENFTDDSAVGVVDFQGANEVWEVSITSLSGGGRAAVLAAINGIPEGLGNTNTAIWDGIGLGYTGVKNEMATYPDNVPAVVALTDGADYQSSDTSSYGYNKLECGSDQWAPWGNISVPGNYPTHWGKYWNYKDANPQGEWVLAGSHGGAYKADRLGLLHSDVTIHTIGLALEHYPAGPASHGVAAPPPEGTRDTYTHIIGTESGTVEYNLWRIANTSGGQYFYSEDGSEIGDIFQTIGQLIIASGFNQTRVASPSPAIRAASNTDKRAVTQSFSLVGVDTAMLSFWNKYDILQGGNGAFLQVGYKTSNGGDWRYRYVLPPGQYTGGLYFDYDVYDDFGNIIKWCWNGLSGSGSFGWDYVSVDISPYVPEGSATDGHVYRSEVCVAFNYTQFGGGTGDGWYIDDVKLEVSRASTAPIISTTKDIWNLTTADAHSGTHSWSNVDPVTGEVKPGIDNYLMTTPIDLTNARTAYLSAYFKFNINYAGGAPPDGFRVEVSSDGGVTWSAVNLGVRSSWSISGTGADAEDGNATDGKAYTGIGDSGQGNYLADDYWVSAGSLSRLNLDLSSWGGNQIFIRFRMVSNNLPDVMYAHDDNANFGADPGFGGFFIDDVTVYGETIFG